MADQDTKVWEETPEGSLLSQCRSLRSGMTGNKHTAMKKVAPYLGLGAGVLLCIPLAFVSVLAGGAGHGTYFPARLLFPFTMFSTFLRGSITAPFVIVGLAQFPLYGLLFGIAYRVGRIRACLYVLIAIHLIAVAVNLIIRSEHFPNLVGGPIDLLNLTVRNSFGSAGKPGITGALPPVGSLEQ